MQPLFCNISSFNSHYASVHSDSTVIISLIFPLIIDATPIFAADDILLFSVLLLTKFTPTMNGDCTAPRINLLTSQSWRGRKQYSLFMFQCNYM